MYFFVIVFGIVYWIIYGNWIGGCLLASLFLVLILSIILCKKEKDQIEVHPEILEQIITEDEQIQFEVKIAGRHFMNSRHFELDYIIEPAFRDKKKKKTVKFIWGKQETPIILSREIKECDDYIVRFTALRWKDLTGIYKVKKELHREVRFLVMPKRFSMEVMNEKLMRQKLWKQGFEYDGIRSYQEGDKLSRIHWKLFAGKGDLFVRKEEEEVDPTQICVEITGVQEKQISDYFQAFYSVSAFLLDEGISQKIYFGKSSFELSHIEQYEELFTKIFREDLRYPVSEEHPHGLKIDIGDGKQSIEDYLYDMEI